MGDCFSKDRSVLRTIVYFTMNRDNFCGAVRTLRVERRIGSSSDVPRRWRRAWPIMSGRYRSS